MTRACFLAPVLFALLFAACGGDEAPASATATAVPPLPTNAVTVVVTATPTSTPAPTATPVPETSEVVLAALKASGLPIVDAVVFDETTDPNRLLGRPNGYLGKVNFRDSRIPFTAHVAGAAIEVSDGGSVEVFASADAAKSRLDYIQAIGKGSSLFVEYGYQKGRILLRVSKELTPSQAAEYQQALAKLRGE